MYCTNCKNVIKDTVNFCPFCGCQINMKADASNSYFRNKESIAPKVKVMLKGGEIKELYFSNFKYYYDRFLTREVKEDDIYHLNTNMPNFYMIGLFGLGNSLLFPFINNIRKK